jgi:anti-sigma factor RsiW
MTQIPTADARAADHRDHLSAWEQLPWLVNGTASEAQRAALDAHIATCDQCREAFERQRSLHRTMNETERAGPPVERGLARLQRRIEASASERSVRSARQGAPRSRWAVLAYGLAAVVLLETGGLAMLSAQLGMGVKRAEPAYRTLSSPAPSAPDGTIRLVVDGRMTVGDLQALLVPLNLQIVAGPGEHGIYTIGPAGPGSDNAAQQIETLRAAHGVRFAEPIVPGQGGQ